MKKFILMLLLATTGFAQNAIDYRAVNLMTSAKINGNWNTSDKIDVWDDNITIRIDADTDFITIDSKEFQEYKILDVTNSNDIQNINGFSYLCFDYIAIDKTGYFCTVKIKLSKDISLINIVYDDLFVVYSMKYVGKH